MRDHISVRPTRLTALLAAVLFLFCLPLQAGVKARLSAPATSLDQPVQLILEEEGDETESPDLSVLDDSFEILGRANQQSVSIINGSVSAKRSLILTLLPKRAGKLTIPPITFGDRKTAQLTLEVSEQPSDPTTAQTQRAWVEMSVNKETAYPEEEIILTLKLYQASEVRGEYLDKPQPSLGDTRLLLLDESKYTVQQEGQTYRVLERNYGLYAYQSGTLEIAPVNFRGRTGGASVFSLFDDPFSRQSQPSRAIRAKSEPVSLHINPIPDTFTGDHWLPTKQLQLVETGIDSSSPIYAGKPLTRRIMLIADGLASSQLPVLSPPVADGIKTYEERPQLRDTPRRTGLSSSRETVVTLIPTRAGRFTLPAIEIPWWNTQSGKQELARLPELTLDVLPGAVTDPPSVEPPVQPQADENTVKPTHKPADAPDTAVASGQDTHWLVWALAAAWLITLAGWWLSHRRRLRTEQPVSPIVESQAADNHLIDAAIEALIETYKMRDAEAARQAWLHWGQLKWPENPPNNLTRLSVRCQQEITEAVISLEKALYSPGEAIDWSSGFDPASLRIQSETASERRSVDDQLLPLNP
jgi:hypothetical protein